MKNKLSISYYIFVGTAFLISLINLRIPSPSVNDTIVNIAKDFLISQAIYWGIFLFCDRWLNNLLTRKLTSSFEKDFFKFLKGFAKFFFPTFAIVMVLIGVGFTLAGVSQLLKSLDNYESLFLIIGVTFCFLGPRIYKISRRLYSNK